VYLDVLFSLPVHSSFTYELPPEMTCAIGYRVTAPFGGRSLTGYVIATHERKPEGFTVKPIKRVIDKEAVFGEDQIALASWMAALYFCSQGEALALMIPGGRKEIDLPALGLEEIPEAHDLELSVPQKEALRSICEDDHSLYYLFGVTGSGKTEVFLQAAQKVIAGGRSVIYLVPEISLTHQLAAMVRTRFAGDVAILHSALTPSQRLKEWLKIRRNEVHLIIGARSAVFAPCADIGLIIIDEEHENTYKAGSTPRYHARQIAIKRAQDAGASVVMGSATPSLEAWRLMKQGRIHRLDLPLRVSGGSMPGVQIVDMKTCPSIISPRLQKMIKEVLDRRKQVILFLNRRGFSYFFHCRSCGYEMTCEHCSVALTYHKERNRMVCHYCGYSQAPIKVCPECGSLDVGYSGFGTELVEEAVHGLFPFARIGRLDADSTKKKEHLKQTLDSFRDGDIDMLLGTQMVAKGLNFPGVELVGIVLADSGLHLPDFRAQERTFSLLLQVAGRAGRFGKTGNVIIQTYQPENAAIRLAALGDVQSFYDQELKDREMLGFPPVTRMCRLVFRARKAERAEQAAVTAADLLEEVIIHEKCPSVTILGPSEPPISKIAQNYRWHILIQATQFKELHRCVDQFLRRYAADSAVYMEIDLDPVNLL
jgi:primosomal protein N' (replication factor Y) (superfamily II helicase)